MRVFLIGTEVDCRSSREVRHLAFSMPRTKRAKEAVAPRKRPVQERSRSTVDVILEAAAQVLERDGYAAATTDLIAERAGVSIGTLYQYFPNKDSILLALTQE